MNTKNYDAIVRMITRLNSIIETEQMSARSENDILDAMSLLRRVLDRRENSPTQNAEEVRTD